jgi:hypothetical protein
MAARRRANDSNGHRLADRTVAMTDAINRRNVPQVRSGPLIAGGVLAGTGAMLVVAGLAIGSAHLFSATRRWVSEMDVPPSQQVRQQWARAKAAAVAGTSAWQNGSAAGVPAG